MCLLIILEFAAFYPETFPVSLLDFFAFTLHLSMLMVSLLCPYRLDFCNFNFKLNPTLLCKCSKDAVGLVCLGFRVQGFRVRVEGLGVEVALTLATLTVRLAMTGIDIIRVFRLVH